MVRFGLSVVAGFALALAAAPGLADSLNKGSHLNTSGQSKVNKALAKGFAAQDPSVKAENRSVVNIGSRKQGNCTVNVGTTQRGQKAPREVVVTAKEIINVCK